MTRHRLTEIQILTSKFVQIGKAHVCVYESVVVSCLHVWPMGWDDNSSKSKVVLYVNAGIVFLNTTSHTHTLVFTVHTHYKTHYHCRVHRLPLTCLWPPAQYGSPPQPSGPCGTCLCSSQHSSAHWSGGPGPQSAGQPGPRGSWPEPAGRTVPDRGNKDQRVSPRCMTMERRGNRVEGKQRSDSRGRRQRHRQENTHLSDHKQYTDTPLMQ